MASAMCSSLPFTSSMASRAVSPWREWGVAPLLGPRRLPGRETALALEGCCTAAVACPTCSRYCDLLSVALAC